jgi:hypothetical protein
MTYDQDGRHQAKYVISSIVGIDLKAGFAKK